MTAIPVTYVTDPMCPWSWAAEPALRRILVEFSGQVAITYVMGGLAREFASPQSTALHALDAAARSGMPVDARVWLDGPPRSSHPACLAVKAAAEQGRDGPYLRAVREGVMVGRRALDSPDVLVDLARETDRIDVARFASDLGSSAVVEAFGADLERAAFAQKAFPVFVVGDGEPLSTVTPEHLSAAVRAAGGRPQPLPGVRDALARWDRMATAEVAAVCDLPAVAAAAELWGLARDHRVRAHPAGGGELWVTG